MCVTVQLSESNAVQKMLCGSAGVVVITDSLERMFLLLPFRIANSIRSDPLSLQSILVSPVQMHVNK